MIEIWKNIPGLEGIEVSNLGRLKGRRGKILKVQRELDGRYRISLRSNSTQRKPKRYLVHRLVMLAFIGPCLDGYQVNHIDGDHTNNKLSNLEYVTFQENMDHASRLGLHRNSRKVNEDDVREIKRRIRSGKKGKDIAIEFGLSRGYVSALGAGKERSYIK